MVKNYFGKEPLQNVNVDEVVAYGATISAYQNLKIHDITNKAIGINAGEKMIVIIPANTVLPVRGKTLLYYRNFKLKNNYNKQQIVRIYEGNNEKISENTYIGKFLINFNKNDKKEKIIKIVMSLDHNSILNVVIKVNDEKNNEFEIKMNYDE